MPPGPHLVTSRRSSGLCTGSSVAAPRSARRRGFVATKLGRTAENEEGPAGSIRGALSTFLLFFGHPVRDGVRPAQAETLSTWRAS